MKKGKAGKLSHFGLTRNEKENEKIRRANDLIDEYNQTFDLLEPDEQESYQMQIRQECQKILRG